MNYKEHRFGPNETIHGIIRKFNRHDMEQDVVDLLVDKFNKLNGPEKRVPRLGEMFKIPLYDFGDEPLSVKPVVEVKKIQPMPQPPTPPIVTAPTVADVLPFTKKEEREIDEASLAKAMISRQRRREEARKAKGLDVTPMNLPKVDSPVEVLFKEEVNIEVDEEKPVDIPPKQKEVIKEVVEEKPKKVKKVVKKKKVEKKPEPVTVEKRIKKAEEKPKRKIPHTRKARQDRMLDRKKKKEDNKESVKKVVPTRRINRRPRRR